MNVDPLESRDDIVDFVKSCFKDWITIMKDAGDDGHISQADIDHSSLLHRLLRKEKIPKFAPPRAFSYPVPSLEMGEVYKPMEVTLESSFFKIFARDNNKDKKYVLIDQSIWELAKKEDKDKYIIIWPHTQRRFSLYREDDFGKWHIKLLEAVEYYDFLFSQRD